MADAASTNTTPRRVARRFMIAGCGIALLVGAGWTWWHNSHLRMLLSFKEAHMKLVGVQMGLHAYWENHGHLPRPAEWKDTVMQNSQFEPVQPVFNSHD